MCGICGYITKEEYSPSMLTDMRDTITYRGPDDSGNWFGEFSSFKVGLAHRRLSIMDLSELGHQPMKTADGRYVIVYNGEIYNDTELRKELKEKGYRFQSGCDTETFLYAFACWNTGCFSKINGMFGVAIWDTVTGTLTLARDRIGKKPLYYYYSKTTKDFVFASELKPIMKFPGFRREINRKAIADYFCNKFIVAPNTIFENTYKMVPGSMLTFSLKTGVIHRERYWDPVEEKSSRRRHLITDINEAVNELDFVLKDAVRRRMIADVTVGSFLSGGIDSTLVTAMAQKEMGKPVKTFSIGFYDKEKDEVPYAKEIAKHIGTDHTEMYVGEDELFRLLPEIVNVYDEPMSDASQIPSMAISKLASKDVKVVVTGDGGDELFCGYNMYDWIWAVQKLDLFGSIASIILGVDHLSMLPIQAKAFIGNRDKRRKTQLFSEVRLENTKIMLKDGVESDVRYPYEDRMSLYDNWQERRMLLDMMTYLPDEILCKMDRASMYYSLETRCPILDYRVVEKSFEIDQRLKYLHFDKKHVLKELTYRYVPKALLDRPKCGFSPPIAEWIRGPLSSAIERYADPQLLKRQGIFDPDGVRKIIDIQKNSKKISHATAVWAFYVFQEWYEEYIEGH